MVQNAKHDLICKKKKISLEIEDCYPGMGRLQFTTNMDATLYSLQYAFIAITSLNLYTNPKVNPKFICERWKIPGFKLLSDIGVNSKARGSPILKSSFSGRQYSDVGVFWFSGISVPENNSLGRKNGRG